MKKLERDVVEHGAPTLAGLKTGNLFPVRADRETFSKELRGLNKVLTGKGVRLIPLGRVKKKILVYLYRPDRLREDLCEQEAETILCEKGYPLGNPERCVAELIRHLESDPVFPHEIGLFLGYPPSDVRCFMSHPCEGVKCTGCWKAYGNEAEAEETFARYRKCTDVYRKVYMRGKPLERLTVDLRRVQRTRRFSRIKFRNGKAGKGSDPVKGT